MVRSNAVWGIDVGNCSLKAMRCYEDDSAPGKLVVDAVDYIEYPMILTQPEANPQELVRDALKLFLSRNRIKGDRIAISIAGQNGLVRFIKLPPIEPKKIPDIVRYEAKQQIPFDLNDVIWDYQRLGQSSGGDMSFPLEVEIGLFAMKRDQVFHILEPYEEVDMPVDYVQLAPLSLYNYMMADEMGELPSMDDYDSENPPPYVVALSMGTDATDLILTNGFRVWQRNLPIGGNNFTKALTRELKLTFAKADHLKRNLASSQDKVAVLKAMQPVFHSFQNEIQRSLGYHSSLDPNAQYERVIALGNAMKLTGLTKYLSKNLGVAVNLGTSFRGLDMSGLADTAVIAENMPTFGICYGLCLQALRRATVQTNLLPSEIRTARIINSKKPWMIAATSLLMLGAAINYGANYSVQGSVAEAAWSSVESSATSLSTKASGDATQVQEAETAIQEVEVIGKNLVGNVEKRLLWIELIRGINECLPKPPAPQPDPDAESIRRRVELHVVNIEAQPLSDDAAEQWLTKVLKKGWLKVPKSIKVTASEGEKPSIEDTIAAMLAPPAIEGLEPAEGEEAPPPADDAEEGAEGPPRRWLISVSGYHFHNGNDLDSVGAQFVRDQFIENIRDKDRKFVIPKPVVLEVKAGEEAEDAAETEDGVEFEAEDAAENVAVVAKAGTGPEASTEEEVSMSDLGVRYPVLIDPQKPRACTIVNPWLEMNRAREQRAGRGGEYVGAGMGPGMGMDAEMGVPRAIEGEGEAIKGEKVIQAERFDFVVHFIWEPRLPSERERIRQARLEAARKAAEEAATEGLDGVEFEGDEDASDNAGEEFSDEFAEDNADATTDVTEN